MLSPRKIDNEAANETVSVQFIFTSKLLESNICHSLFRTLVAKFTYIRDKRVRLKMGQVMSRVCNSVQPEMHDTVRGLWASTKCFFQLNIVLNLRLLHKTAIRATIEPKGGPVCFLFPDFLGTFRLLGSALL